MRVKCINNRQRKPHVSKGYVVFNLTVGNIYEVSRVTENRHYKILNDKGKVKTYAPCYFEEVRVLPNVFTIFKKGDKQMKNYIMLDGKKLPISDETAEAWRKEFRPKPKSIYDLKKGDRYYYLLANGGYGNNTLGSDTDGVFANRCAMNNAFLTKEEAEIADRQRRFHANWKRYFHQISDEPLEGDTYHRIAPVNGELTVKTVAYDDRYMKPYMYFNSNIQALKFIDTYEDDLKEFFGIQVDRSYV